MSQGAVWLGRLALRAWPADHRVRFGDEMLLVFEEAWEAAGSLARLRLVVDLLAGGFRDRLGPSSIVHRPSSIVHRLSFIVSHPATDHA